MLSKNKVLWFKFSFFILLFLVLSFTSFATLNSQTLQPNPNVPIHIKLVDDLVGYWKFEEGTGTIAYDSSGYGNNGTLMNGPTWVNGLSSLGKALQFDGADDYIKIDDSETISSPCSTRAITVTAWVKPDTGIFEGFARVVAAHWTNLSGTCPSGDGSNAWLLEARQDRKFHSVIGQGDGITYIDMPSKTPLQEGVWQHLAFTWDGSIITFYFNGVADTSASYTGNMTNSSCEMQIGKTDIWYWKGLLDEVKLYNRSLSREEIWNEFLNSFQIGDVNCDGKVTVSDVVYLINYLFKGGPPPCRKTVWSL